MDAWRSISRPMRATDPFIVDVMKRFELCFQVPCPEGECILVPDLLPVEQPELGNWEDECVRFEIRYEVLPASVTTRLISRMHNLGLQGNDRRTGNDRAVGKDARLWCGATRRDPRH